MVASIKDLVDGYVQKPPRVANMAAPAPEECVPPDGIRCIGGWHFRNDVAIRRCDEKRRQEIRAKIDGERQRLRGELELLGPAGASFEGYDVHRHEGAVAALNAMQRFSQGRPPARGVLLVSPNGLGKTRLLLASHFALLEAGVPSLYVTTPELRKWFRRAMSYDEEIEREARAWLDRFTYAQAIHFDDAGHVENDQRARGEFNEGIKSLLDTSAAAWAVATNRSSREMETHPDLSGTVASRFQFNADVVVMRGLDFRVESSR